MQKRSGTSARALARFFTATCLATSGLSAPAWAAPDLIVYNADVYTVDEQIPRAEAFAVEGGKFTAMGTNDAIRALADAETQLIDAKGNTVTPGFIDSHQHVSGTGANLDLYVKSREEWARLIRAEHERLPKGEWLLGRSWDHTIIDDVLPTKEFLDEIVGDRPTVLRHVDGHFVWVNSAVIKMAGITADTPVPPGGEIVVDPATGEPTGILKEGAARLVDGLVPVPTQEQRYAAMPATVHWLNSMGVTGMHNMSDHDNWLNALEQGNLTVRVWHGHFGFNRNVEELSIPERVQKVTELREQVRSRVAATGRTEQVGPLFDIGFVKLMNDGVLSIHTAVLLDSYIDRPDWKGEFMIEPEELAEQVQALSKAGFQVAIHSIGDAAVRASLDAFESAKQYNGNVGLPHRIEHVELSSRQDVPRFAELNVVASMTPNHQTKAVAYIEDRIDPDRESHAYTWRSLLAAGAKVIFGSDSTTSIHQDPIKQIGDALYRTNHAGFNDSQPWHSEQVVTFAEALRAYTLGPAETTAWGDEIGSISKGKWADFVILDTKVPEPGDRSIFDIKVDQTYFAGRKVFDRE
jgi:predicted amidohydrolase YtcJ